MFGSQHCEHKTGQISHIGLLRNESGRLRVSRSSCVISASNVRHTYFCVLGCANMYNISSDDDDDDDEALVGSSAFFNLCSCDTSPVCVLPTHAVWWLPAAKGSLYLSRSLPIYVTVRLIADQQRQQLQPLPDHVGLTQVLYSPVICVTETATLCLPSNDH